MSEKCEVCGQAVDEIEKKVCKILSSKHEIPEEACRELMDLRAKNYIDVKMFYLRLAEYGIKADEFNKVLDDVIDEVEKKVAVKLVQNKK